LIAPADDIDQIMAVMALAFDLRRLLPFALCLR
jgi:hypothetical protein